MTQEFITQQLWQAAEQRRVCKIKLRQELFVRIIHPYGICRTKHNKIVIVCWQAEGPSLGESLYGYRNLRLENCQSVELLEKTFRVQPDFNPEDPLYREWVFHI
jgi:hypothetical protein